MEKAKGEKESLKGLRLDRASPFRDGHYGSSMALGEALSVPHSVSICGRYGRWICMILCFYLFYSAHLPPA